MKLIQKDIEELRSILAACKVLGIEGVVIAEGMARGAKISLDAAIISDTSLPHGSLKLGIGRVSELEKRLAVFGSDAVIDGKTNDSGDVTVLTISAGKSKMQFRCTSSTHMKYPKENSDQPVATITMSKAEVIQLTRAAKTLSAETVVLIVSRTGDVRLECVDSGNDKFEIALETEAKYEDEQTSLVKTYLAGMLVDMLDNAVKETEQITFVVGEVGSITTKVKNHTVMLMPQISGEED